MGTNYDTSAYKLADEPLQGREYLKVLTANPLDVELKLDDTALDYNSKIELISKHFAEIMRILGLDLTDDSLKDTPKRVAKMYVNEIFSGLNPANKPSVTLFENKYQYNEMLIENNIKVHSYCEHHFVPIIGKAHVAYISNGKVIGLSKINRIVDYFSRRPQVQERLTVQIAEELKRILQTDDVAVVITADHMCVTLRGIKDQDSSTYTSSFHGKFKEKEYRREFLDQINSSTKNN
jgi:GTP cyclohydrolase I